MARQSASARERSRSGMTLLEIMLALTLTAFVLASVSMAIDLHLRILDARRDDVERVQVARAVLRMIANDLRSAVQPLTTDFSCISAMAVNAAAESAGGDAASGDAMGDATDAMADLEMDADAALDAAESASTDVASSDVPPPVPGLYGNANELQLDVSRLPRVDQMQRMVAASAIGPLEDIPSDVKTVAYYVHDPNSAMSSGDFRDAAGNPQAGLVRRVLDRAVTLYAADNVNTTSVENAGEIIAPEIGALQFEYWDGLEWVYEWDSEEMGGLPMAVRITVILLPEEMQTPGSLSEMTLNDLEMQEAAETYSLTVRLPTAMPMEEEMTDESGMEAVGL